METIDLIKACLEENGYTVEKANVYPIHVDDDSSPGRVMHALLNLVTGQDVKHLRVHVGNKMVAIYPIYVWDTKFAYFQEYDDSRPKILEISDPDCFNQLLEYLKSI